MEAPEASSSAPGDRPAVVDPTLSKCPPKTTIYSKNLNVSLTVKRLFIHTLSLLGPEPWMVATTLA